MITPARFLIVALLTLGLAGLHPLTTFAATTVSDCPTTESALSTDISSAGTNGTVFFTCTGDTTISFTSPITIGQSVTLDASSAGGTVTFDGGGTTLLFSVSGAVNFSLKHLTLQDGGGNSIGYGGAISNSGTVTITSSTLSGNTTRTGGGAIYNSAPGTVTITNSTLSGNSVQHGLGGAIINYGTVTITNSTLSGNIAPAPGSGGAIENSGTVTITNSTLSGNSATFSAGAIDNSGMLTITNSTLSDNSAWYWAGAIVNSGILIVGGSIMANNTPGSICRGIVIDTGYNLSDERNCGFSTANHDLINTNPRLGPLQNNGGPTQTMALLSTSPAIDQIPRAICPSTDQRGDPRPDAGESRCDIGAYESSYIETTTTFTSSLNPSTYGQSVTITATITPTISSSGAPTGTVTFDDGNTEIGTGTVSTTNGVTSATLTTTSLEVGKHTITATYNGDTTYSSSSATGTQTVTQTVSQASTITGITSSANPSFSGQPVTFTATVSSSGSTTPTGTIQFGIDGKDVGSPVTLVGGKATSPAIPSLAPGTHTVIARYSGDATDQGSTGSLKQTVQPSVLTGSLAFSVHPTEGQPFSGPVAAFTDTNTFISASQLSATIHWGDGSSSPGTISGSGGSFTVSGSHPYKDEGSVPVSVTLQETTPGRASGTARGTVTVAEGDVLTPTTSSLPTATVGRSYTLTATFTDTNVSASPSDFHATITWGDGTTSTGTVSGSLSHLVVSGRHTYTLTGHNPITVTLRDDAPGTARATAHTTLTVVAPASSPGALVTIVDNSLCTTIQSAVSVSPIGTATGSLSLVDARAGGTPCGPSRPGVLSLRSTTIAALVCTSATTATIYGQVQQGGPAGAVTSFRADVVLTNPTARINGSVSVQTSNGYSSGGIPATVHISGC